MALTFWNDQVRMQRKTGMRNSMPNKALWGSNELNNNKDFWSDDFYKIASLDTLFIMGFAKEYKTTKDEILTNLKKKSVRYSLFYNNVYADFI